MRIRKFVISAGLVFAAAAVGIPAVASAASNFGEADGTSIVPVPAPPREVNDDSIVPVPAAPTGHPANR